MKQLFVFFILLTSSVSVASASISPLDPMAAAMITSDVATNASESYIEVPVGAEIKLAYRENPASSATIVKWDVVASKGGLDIIYTENFMGGKITRFLAREGGLYKVVLTALDDSQIIHTREFTVNVTDVSGTTPEDVNTEDTTIQRVELDVTKPNSEKDNNNQKPQVTNATNASNVNQQSGGINSTNVTNLSNSIVDNKSQVTRGSSDDGGMGTFVLFMLVLIPALYMMRKRGVV